MEGKTIVLRTARRACGGEREPELLPVLRHVDQLKESAILRRGCPPPEFQCDGNRTVGSKPDGNRHPFYRRLNARKPKRGLPDLVCRRSALHNQCGLPALPVCRTPDGRIFAGLIVQYPR